MIDQKELFSFEQTNITYKKNRIPIIQRTNRRVENRSEIIKSRMLYRQPLHLRYNTRKSRRSEAEFPFCCINSGRTRKQFHFLLSKRRFATKNYRLTFGNIVNFDKTVFSRTEEKLISVEAFIVYLSRLFFSNSDLPTNEFSSF